MVNPPTRAYTEEELKEVVEKLKSNNGKTPSPVCVPTRPIPAPSVKPIPLQKEKAAIETKASTPEKTGFNDNSKEHSTKMIQPTFPNNQSNSSTFFQRYGYWIMIAGILVLVSACIYWDYQRRKKDQERQFPES